MTWHDDNAFWEAFAPFMFTEQKIAATPIEVDHIIKLLDLNPGATILDMGCGLGRHSLELARRGYRVTGLDRTAYFIKTARNLAKAENLDIELILDDMRSFQRLESFDAVISMFTSFGYFADMAENRLVLRNMYHSLREGGAVLLETMGKEILARIYRERDWVEQDGVFHLQERRVSKHWSWMENRWILLKEGFQFEYEVSHWLFSASEFVALLEESGFVHCGVYGGLDGGPYDHTAQRLVVVGKKG